MRGRSPWLWPDVIYNLSPAGREFNKCLSILHGFTDKVYHGWCTADTKFLLECPIELEILLLQAIISALSTIQLSCTIKEKASQRHSEYFQSSIF